MITERNKDKSTKPRGTAKKIITVEFKKLLHLRSHQKFYFNYLKVHDKACHDYKVTDNKNYIQLYDSQIKTTIHNFRDGSKSIRKYKTHIV